VDHNQNLGLVNWDTIINNPLQGSNGNNGVSWGRIAGLSVGVGWKVIRAARTRNGTGCQRHALFTRMFRRQDTARLMARFTRTDIVTSSAPRHASGAVVIRWRKAVSVFCRFVMRMRYVEEERPYSRARR